jgi:hypothetical protein
MSGPSVSGTSSTQSNAASAVNNAPSLSSTPAERMISGATASNGTVDTKALAGMVADAAVRPRRISRLKHP